MSSMSRTVKLSPARKVNSFSLLSLVLTLQPLQESVCSSLSLVQFLLLFRFVMFLHLVWDSVDWISLCTSC